MRLGLLLLLFSLCVPVQAWQENRVSSDPQEVSTYVRDVPDSSVNAFRGVVTLDANVMQLLAISAAVDTFPEWVFQAKSAQVIEQPTSATRVAFNGIWPVSDRDVVVSNSLSQASDTGAVTLRSQLLDGAEEHSGYVRIPAFDNRFIFTPLADGMTRVEFETFVNPGGRVPAWLSNLISNRAPLVTLEGMKAQLEKDRFQYLSADDTPHFDGVDQLDLSWWD